MPSRGMRIRDMATNHSSLSRPDIQMQLLGTNLFVRQQRDTITQHLEKSLSITMVMELGIQRLDTKHSVPERVLTIV